MFLLILNQSKSYLWLLLLVKQTDDVSLRQVHCTVFKCTRVQAWVKDWKSETKVEHTFLHVFWDVVVTFKEVDLAHDAAACWREIFPSHCDLPLFPLKCVFWERVSRSVGAPINTATTVRHDYCPRWLQNRSVKCAKSCSSLSHAHFVYIGR